MEEKAINEKESLELISQMIKTTKTNLGKGSGNALLIWGYSCLIASAVVMVMAYILHVQHAGWAYFLIPILGISATLVLKRMNRDTTEGQAITYIAKSLEAMYGSCSFVFTAYIAIAFYHYDNHVVWKGAFFLGCFIPAFCTMATGTLMRIKNINVLGIIGIVLSLVLLANFMIGDGVNIVGVVFGIVSWICSLIIPGHILNHEAKKQMKK